MFHLQNRQIKGKLGDYMYGMSMKKRIAQKGGNKISR
jgi:hypothetical protein